MTNGNEYGKIFTFGVIVRGELEFINNLINFLNTSGLTIAHQELGTKKLWIRETTGEEYYER